MICSYFFRIAKGKIPDLCSNISRVIFLLCFVSARCDKIRCTGAGGAGGGGGSGAVFSGAHAGATSLPSSGGTEEPPSGLLQRPAALGAPLPDQPIYDAPNFHLM